MIGAENASRIPLARFMQIESAFIKVLQDVNKLKDISVGHGNQIRDLYGTSANAVSKAELMAATTSMKFRNFNSTAPASQSIHTDVNSFREGLTASSTGNQPQEDGTIKSSRDDRLLRLLKNDLERIENESIAREQKSAVEVRRLEQELIYSRKEVQELKTRCKHLESSQYAGLSFPNTSSDTNQPSLEALKKIIDDQFISAIMNMEQQLDHKLSSFNSDSQIIQNKSQVDAIETITFSPRFENTIVGTEITVKAIRRLSQSVSFEAVSTAIVNVNMIRNTERRASGIFKSFIKRKVESTIERQSTIITPSSLSIQHEDDEKSEIENSTHESINSNTITDITNDDMSSNININTDDSIGNSLFLKSNSNFQKNLSVDNFINVVDSAISNSKDGNDAANGVVNVHSLGQQREQQIIKKTSKEKSLRVLPSENPVTREKSAGNPNELASLSGPMSPISLSVSAAKIGGRVVSSSSNIAEVTDTKGGKGVSRTTNNENIDDEVIDESHYNIIDNSKQISPTMPKTRMSNHMIASKSFAEKKSSKIKFNVEEQRNTDISNKNNINQANASNIPVSVDNTFDDEYKENMTEGPAGQLQPTFPIEMVAKMSMIEAANMGAAFRLDNALQRIDQFYLTMKLLDDEHSALLSSHKILLNKVTNTEAVLFATVNQLAGVIENCYTTIERQEKKSIEQNRQINELLSVVNELSMSKPSTQVSSARNSRGISRNNGSMFSVVGLASAGKPGISDEIMKENNGNNSENNDNEENIGGFKIGFGQLPITALPEIKSWDELISEKPKASDLIDLDQVLKELREYSGLYKDMVEKFQILSLSQFHAGDGGSGSGRRIPGSVGVMGGGLGSSAESRRPSVCTPSSKSQSRESQRHFSVSVSNPIPRISGSAGSRPPTGTAAGQSVAGNNNTENISNTAGITSRPGTDSRYSQLLLQGWEGAKSVALSDGISAFPNDDVNTLDAFSVVNNNSYPSRPQSVTIPRVEQYTGQDKKLEENVPVCLDGEDGPIVTTRIPSPMLYTSNVVANIAPSRSQDDRRKQSPEDMQDNELIATEELLNNPDYASRLISRKEAHRILKTGDLSKNKEILYLKDEIENIRRLLVWKVSYSSRQRSPSPGSVFEIPIVEPLLSMPNYSDYRHTSAKSREFSGVQSPKSSRHGGKNINVSVPSVHCVDDYKKESTVGSQLKQQKAIEVVSTESSKVSKPQMPAVLGRYLSREKYKKFEATPSSEDLSVDVQLKLMGEEDGSKEVLSRQAEGLIGPSPPVKPKSKIRRYFERKNVPGLQRQVSTASCISELTNNSASYLLPKKTATASPAKQRDLLRLLINEIDCKREENVEKFNHTWARSHKKLAADAVHGSAESNHILSDDDYDSNLGNGNQNYSEFNSKINLSDSVSF